MLGGSLFAASVTAGFLRRLTCSLPPTEPRQERIELSDVTKKETIVLETEGGGSMKRNDSEFSLGLTRSESFDETVNTLGPLCIFPLCDTGEALWGIGEYTAKIFFAVIVCKAAFDVTGRIFRAS